MHWTQKQSGQSRVGEELQRRGWTLFGYQPGEADGMTDYYRPAYWDGVATNADYPGIVVGVVVSGRRMSGKERDGVTWPRYMETPKGVAWHVQQDGGTSYLKTGKGLSRCGGYMDTAWQAAVRAMCDAIEHAAADAAGVARPEKPEMEQRESRASAGGLTVRCTVSGDWTWIDIAPRIDREAYLRFKDRFGARWSKRRQAVYLTRHVTPEEILAFLRPGEEAPREPDEPAMPEPGVAGEEAPPEPEPAQGNHIKEEAGATVAQLSLF
jgi:hypothetical protein